MLHIIRNLLIMKKDHNIIIEIYNLVAAAAATAAKPEGSTVVRLYVFWEGVEGSMLRVRCWCWHCVVIIHDHERYLIREPARLYVFWGGGFHVEGEVVVLALCGDDHERYLIRQPARTLMCPLQACSFNLRPDLS